MGCPLLVLLSKYNVNIIVATVFGKNHCLVWDGSTQLLPTNIVLNQIGTMKGEPIVDFGASWKNDLIYIYNTQVSFPFIEIYLSLVDVTAAYRYPKRNADLAGAFVSSACGL